MLKKRARKKSNQKVLMIKRKKAKKATEERSEVKKQSPLAKITNRAL